MVKIDILPNGTLQVTNTDDVERTLTELQAVITTLAPGESKVIDPDTQSFTI